MLPLNKYKFHYLQRSFIQRCRQVGEMLKPPFHALQSSSVCCKHGLPRSLTRSSPSSGIPLRAELAEARAHAEAGGGLGTGLDRPGHRRPRLLVGFELRSGSS